MTARLFRNALLANGQRVDLAVRDGRFVDSCEPDETVDLGGLLVLPGFVDGHIHLDKSFVGDRWRPHQQVGSLRERLVVEKRLLGESLPIAKRADALMRQAYAYGTIAMRSHVDVDATTGLTHLHAIRDVCDKWRDRITVELVAFPQAGILTCPGTADLLEAAVREGVQVVGGIDPTEIDGDAEKHLDVVFGIAGRHGVKIDIHLHERGAGGIQQIERIAARTTAIGAAGRVTISHAYSLGDISEDEAKRVGAILAAAGVAIMTNAPGNHAFPPVAVLNAEGVRVFAGNDNIRDAWWPYGNGDMLERAMMIGYRSGFYTDDELDLALRMATSEPARVLNLNDYGIAVGNAATFVILDAPNAAAAVAAPPADRILVQRGQLIGPQTPQILQRLSAN